MVKQCNDNFKNCVVSVDEVVDFDWDKMYVFREGVGNEMIEKILGTKLNNSFDSTGRRIVFVRSDKVVYEELYIYDTFEGLPNESTFFEYNEDNSSFYIFLDKKNAIFKITSVDHGDKTYYQLSPIR